jgi:hypothetical protein
MVINLKLLEFAKLKTEITESLLTAIHKIINQNAEILKKLDCPKKK